MSVLKPASLLRGEILRSRVWGNFLKRRCCTKTEEIENEERNDQFRAEILWREDSWRTRKKKVKHLF